MGDSVAGVALGALAALLFVAMTVLQTVTVMNISAAIRGVERAVRWHAARLDMVLDWLEEGERSVLPEVSAADLYGSGEDEGD